MEENKEEQDDFVESDIDAGIITTTEIVKAEPVNNSVGRPATNMLEHRDELISIYHGGANSLADKLTKQKRNNINDMVLALVDEVIRETDHLLGNELIAGEQGDLRDASIISTKRAEVLEKAIKAVQTKQILDQEHGLDVKSPAMRVVFRFFLKKVKQTFTKLNYADEAADVFFKTFSDITGLWEKELKQELDEMQVLNTNATQFNIN